MKKWSLCTSVLSSFLFHLLKHCIPPYKHNLYSYTWLYLLLQFFNSSDILMFFFLSMGHLLFFYRVVYFLWIILCYFIQSFPPPSRQINLPFLWTPIHPICIFFVLFILINYHCLLLGILIILKLFITNALPNV